MDIHSEAYLQLVHPFLAAKIRLLAYQLANQFPIKVSAGLRTFPNQHMLWLKGRDEEGNVIDAKKIVTNADGGYSWHNFGCAVDCEPVQKDGSIDWDSSHPQWEIMEKAGIALGLTSGAHWQRIVDAPHFQIQDPFPIGAPNDAVRKLFKEQGLRAVWNAIVPIVDTPEVEL